MITIAVCSVFKDEGPNLLEWIAYHRSLGIDHFFLYDNESTDGGPSIIQTDPLKNYVTVIPMPPRPAQWRAYKHFIDNYASNWDWAAFIDLDEFIHPIEADSIKDLLPRYEAFSGILLHWLNFGPNGHDRRPDGLVIENYTSRLFSDHPINRHVKSLVKTGCLIGEPHAHVTPTRGPMCNSSGEPVSTEPIQDGVCHDVMCINHYYTKSREDWLKKRRKGRVDVLENTMLDIHFTHYARDCNVIDKRITRLAPRVKAMLLSYPSSPERNLAYGKKVAASGVDGGHIAANAVDGDPATFWNAGGFPPQWIEIDLGRPCDIKGARLITSQTPAGPTTHEVYGKGPGTGGAWQLLHRFQGDTADGQALDQTWRQPVIGIERIRVVTTTSPSWVSWREIEIIGSEWRP